MTGLIFSATVMFGSLLYQTIVCAIVSTKPSPRWTDILVPLAWVMVSALVFAFRMNEIILELTK